MLSDYRAWLRSELDLLGNASHHAYAFGQANMAKRAIERFDAETRDAAVLVVSRERAVGILTALEMLAEKGALAPELARLREELAAALPAPTAAEPDPGALPESTHLL